MSITYLIEKKIKIKYFHNFITNIKIAIIFIDVFLIYFSFLSYFFFLSHILLHEASPKAISKRTSYHWVWLAFHPYPQLIQTFFNTNWFGPPLRVTVDSTWPWIDHSASGLLHATRRAIHTRFRFGSVLNLTSQHTVSRRLIMQKACRRLRSDTL